MNAPGVSCVCPTYGRPPHLLEEAVQSFLMQDYEGEKELLILNDCAAQTLHFDHPEVTVVNITERFATLGAKRNAAIARCRHDLLAVWDDDDICLPHRLTYSARYCAETRYYRAPECLIVHNGAIVVRDRTARHITTMWERELFRDAGCYPHLNSAEDLEMDRRFNSSLGYLPYVAMPDSATFYLYRWGGTGSYHMSGFRGAGSRRAASEAFVAEAIRQGRLPHGDIELHPRWTRDWCELVAEWNASRR